MIRKFFGNLTQTDKKVEATAGGDSVQKDTNPDTDMEEKKGVIVVDTRQICGTYFVPPPYGQ